MLIVVAIIAILVAISFGIFSNNKKKAVTATNAANIRTAIAQSCTEYANGGKTKAFYFNNFKDSKHVCVDGTDADGNLLSKLDKELCPLIYKDSGLICSVFVKVDQDGTVKTYPYIDENGKMQCDYVSKSTDPGVGLNDWLFCYQYAKVNHFDKLK